ncbi:hypothetical protein MHK_003028 [Candidatus Magnetomorum sp. HK-1]|nr:hypothetical protein MHK_003028 [Candidatus Magnetomorum sp. HK-1]
MLKRLWFGGCKISGTENFTYSLSMLLTALSQVINEFRVWKNQS